MAEAITLGPIELALHAFVVSASGLASDKVIWSGYGRRRPAITPGEQWISLELSDSGDDAWPWVDEMENPLTFSAITFTASATTPPGLLTAATHGRATGDGPVRVATTGTRPGGLAAATDYWVIVLSSSTFRLAASFADAMAATPVPVTITTAGTGTHTLVATADTVRAGEELLEVVSQPVEQTLSIQCYGGPPTGDRSPMNVLRTVIARARLNAQMVAFEAAGIGVEALGRINNVGAVLSGTRWEPRAHVDVTVSMTSEVTAPIGRIDIVEVTLEESHYVETGSLAMPLAAPLGQDGVIATTTDTFDITADDV